MGKRTLWLAEAVVGAIVILAMFLKYEQVAMVGIGAFATLLGKLNENG